MGSRQLVEDFHLFGGQHCETSAVRKVLAYDGLELSEEMLLGLGCGIGFLYWYTKRMPAPLIGGRGGRSEDLMANIGRAIDGTVARITTGSPGRAHSTLVERLGARTPTVVFGDIAYLPYMGVGESEHFGGHSFVVYGIDEEEDVVHVSDRAERPLTVTVDQLRRSRGSRHPPFAPRHAFLDVQHPRSVEVEAEDVTRGIVFTVRAMTEPPFSNAGLPGIVKWAEEVRRWPEIFPGPKMYRVLVNAFVYIETGGTGGGSFRPMYCRFLEEAKDFLHSPALDDAIDGYTQSGEIWSDIAGLCLPDDHSALSRTRELLWEKDGRFLRQEPEDGRTMDAINSELAMVKPKATDELKEPSMILRRIVERIHELHEVEKKAVESLERTIS